MPVNLEPRRAQPQVRAHVPKHPIRTSLMLRAPEQIPAVLTCLRKHRQPARRELETHPRRKPQVSLIYDDEPRRQVQQLIRGEHVDVVMDQPVVCEHRSTTVCLTQRPFGQGVALARTRTPYVALDHAPGPFLHCSRAQRRSRRRAARRDQYLYSRPPIGHHSATNAKPTPNSTPDKNNATQVTTPTASALPQEPDQYDAALTVSYT